MESTMAISEEIHSDTDTKRKWYMINTRLLPVKGCYFFFFAAIGDLLPFIPIYMKQQGLSTSETGIIYGILPFVAFFTSPIVGGIADRIKKHKLVLVVCILLVGVFYTSLLAIPSSHTERVVKIRTNIHCNPEDSFIRDCVEYVDKNEACYLTLSEYGNLTSNRNASQRVSCNVQCSFAEPGAYNSEVCFAKDAGSYRNRKKCVDIWISASSDQVVKFKLSNVSEIIRHEIIRDAIELPHLHCREYDLKHILYGQTAYWQILCEKESILHCVLTCQHFVGSKCQAAFEFKNQFGFTFWMLFVILLLAYIVFSPIVSIIDAVTYTILGNTRSKWGQQRLWGTAGFAVFAVTSTFIMDMKSKNQKKIDYSISFYIFLGLCISAAVNACFIKFSSKISCGQFFKNVVRLLTNPRIVSFLVVVTIFGMFTGAIEGFLFWYLLDLGSSQKILGLALAANCIPELFCLSFSGKIIQKIGHLPCLYISSAAYVLRFLSYSFISDPWYVLLIEPLHGVTFGLMWAAATSYASIIAPPGMAAVTQGLIGGLHFGFGKGSGCLITGFLFEVLTERWTFRLLAGVSLLALVVYLLVNIFVFKETKPGKGPAYAVTDNKEDYDEDSSAVHDHLVSDCSSDSPTKLSHKTEDVAIETE